MPFRTTINLAENDYKPGVYEIGKRKYYLYLDTNDTIVVIPNWYRWTGAFLAPVGLVLGIYVGLAVNWLSG